MGCDIHFHVEVKLKEKWEHLCSIKIDRDYDLFSLLVNDYPRSNGKIKGIYGKRGYPEDINELTKFLISEAGCHTHSYLYPTEIKKFAPKETQKNIYLLFCKHVESCTYRNGDIAFWLIDECSDISDFSDENVRFVFGFDN